MFSFFALFLFRSGIFILLLPMSSNAHLGTGPILPCCVCADNVIGNDRSVQCCHCFNWVRTLRCSLYSCLEFSSLSNSHSCSCPSRFFLVVSTPPTLSHLLRRLLARILALYTCTTILFMGPSPFIFSKFATFLRHFCFYFLAFNEPN